MTSRLGLDGLFSNEVGLCFLGGVVGGVRGLWIDTINMVDPLISNRIIIKFINKFYLKKISLKFNKIQYNENKYTINSWLKECAYRNYILLFLLK